MILKWYWYQYHFIKIIYSLFFVSNWYSWYWQSIYWNLINFIDVLYNILVAPNYWHVPQKYDSVKMKYVLFLCKVNILKYPSRLTYNLYTHLSSGYTVCKQDTLFSFYKTLQPISLGVLGISLTGLYKKIIILFPSDHDMSEPHHQLGQVLSSQGAICWEREKQKNNLANSRERAPF